MSEAEVLTAEDAFFAALLDADRPALDRLLAEDFLLIDVLAGQAVTRTALLDLVGSGELVFTQIDRPPGDVSVRQRPGLAVVVGRTRMRMRVPGAEVTADSRYTHVYVLDGDRWRLLTAQGTRLAEPTEPTRP
jgi:ketosteroid isomerase-like protein